MKLIRSFDLILLVLICAVSSRAQPAAVQQLQNNQMNAQQQMPLPGLRAGTNAPELYPGENMDVGPQRILRQNPRVNWFDVHLDGQIFISDNPTYSPAHIPSLIYVNTVQAAFTPPPINLGPGKAALEMGYASQWYNYDRQALTSLDFDAQTAFVGARYSSGKWLAVLNFNYTRLLSQPDNYDQIYQEFLPSLTLQRFFIIHDKMLLAIGDQVDYHITKIPADVAGLASPNSPAGLNDHFDNIIFATFNYQVTQHFAIQPFYRFQYSYYRRNTFNTASRDDCLNALGITMIYNFNQYISARVFLNYNRLHTTDPVTPSYAEMNGGIGASLDIKF